MLDHTFIAAVVPMLIISTILGRRCLRLAAELDALRRAQPDPGVTP